MPTFTLLTFLHVSSLWSFILLHTKLGQWNIHEIYIITKQSFPPEIWAWVSSANPLDHLLVCDAKLLARKQQSGHDSSLRVCMNNRSCSCTQWGSQRALNMPSVSNLRTVHVCVYSHPSWCMHSWTAVCTGFSLVSLLQEECWCPVPQCCTQTCPLAADKQQRCCMILLCIVKLQCCWISKSNCWLIF